MMAWQMLILARETASPPTVILKNRKKGNESGRAIMYITFIEQSNATGIATESNAAHTIEGHFEERLADGILMWEPFSSDDSGGEEYEKRFDVGSNALAAAKKTGQQSY